MPTNFKNLDYAQIKASLVEHLKTLKEFQDFNFEASGIQQILSLLAYNTAYNAFYLNMVGSEMFLDSAQLRSSVTSRAKAIGYTPRSARAARARIRVEMEGVSDLQGAKPPFIQLKTTDEFQAYLDGVPYTFTPDRTYLIEPNVNGVYAADITLVEGKRLTHEYVVDATSPVKQRFEIPNKSVDTSTLNVKVKESAASAAIMVYLRAGNVNNLTSESSTYFLQENENELYEVSFGEDVLGLQPKTGNIVILQYLVASGPVVNGIRVFGKTGLPEGARSLKITTLEAARDGTDKEDNASIKLLAPLLYEAQDRAVTRNDYEALIRKDNASIEFVRVWGGEDNEPPDFGKVYAAIKPKTGTRLSTDEKATIENRLLKERNVVSIEVKIVDPEYLFLNLLSRVNFRAKQTVLNAVDVKNAVYRQIVSYKNSVLNGFDADFSHSKLVSTIDSVERSIVGNITTLELKKRIYPVLDVPSRFEINFYNPLSRGDSANNVNAITSSAFIYRGIATYIGDDGKGSLYLYRIANNQKIIIETGIGSVDYSNGIVILDALDVQDIVANNFIEIVATPSVYDIYTPREAILLLNDEDIQVFVSAIDVLGEKA